MAIWDKLDDKVDLKVVMGQNPGFGNLYIKQFVPALWWYIEDRKVSWTVSGQAIHKQTR